MLCALSLLDPADSRRYVGGGTTTVRTLGGEVPAVYKNAAIETLSSEGVTRLKRRSARITLPGVPRLAPVRLASPPVNGPWCCPPRVPPPFPAMAMSALPALPASSPMATRADRSFSSPAKMLRAMQELEDDGALEGGPGEADARPGC